MSGTVLPDVHDSHFPRGDKEEHPFFSVVRVSEGWKDWLHSQRGTLSHLCRLGSGTDSWRRDGRADNLREQAGNA